MANEPQPVAVEDAFNSDGWMNELTGMAKAARDKREADVAGVTSLSYDTCLAVYQSSWLAARIVDKPAEDMTREGFDVHVKDQEETGEAIQGYLEDLDLDCCTEQALKWQRLFGGSLVLVGINDGQADLSQPVEEKSIQGIDYLNVFDASEARPVTWQDNPAEEGYGEPLMWCIQPTVIGQERQRDGLSKALGPASGKLDIPGMQFIHASRVFAFPGVVISRRHAQMIANPGMQRGWGDGVLARCIKLIRDFEGSWDGAAFQLREFSQSIYKITGLANSLLSDKGEKGNSYIQRRMRAIEMSRSLLRAVMLDKADETFERSESSFTGVADTLREFATVLAAAADIPVSVLMGAQGGGLGASGSGQNDVQNWYAAVKAKQNKTLKPFLTYLVKLICKAKDLGVRVKMARDRHGNDQPQGVRVEFRSLYQLTDAEQAALYVQLATADEKYLNMGAISALDIGRARFSGKPLKVTMVADPGELEAREEMAQEMETTQHEVTVSNLQEHGSATPPAPAKVPFGGK